MMGALPQTATSALPPFLTALAPVPGAETGEGGAFDQLVAQQTPGAGAVSTPVPTVVLTGENTLSLPTAEVPEKPVQPIMIEADPAAHDAAETPAPTVEVQPATDKAVVAANELLATLAHFTTAAPKPATARPDVASPKSEGESETGEEGDAAADAIPVAVAALVPAAIEPRVTPKSATEATSAKARRDDALPMPMAAPKAREAAAALPFLSIDTPVTKTSSEASMTVLFSQPATQATAIAEAAKPAIVAERVLDMTSDDAWIEQLAADIAATKSASNDVSFRLMPRHLGRLDVSMMMGDEGVSLKLDTQHEATATIVNAAQVRLVDDLRQQGVRVAETQVTHTPDQAGRQSQQGQGRSPAQDAAHLIETATERAAPREARDQERAGNRRERFA